MASNTSNVKMGVCKVIYKGVDLGYTKGGVNVDVTTSTHPVTIDQFGESIINEYITKREIKVTCPLAETTLENLVLTMPGATLLNAGAVKATGNITFVTAIPAPLDTITVNGVVFTYRASAPLAVLPTDIFPGTTVTTAAANTAIVLNASFADGVTDAIYTSALGVLTITADVAGIAGNAFTIAKSAATPANITVSGATLASGAEAPLGKRVDVKVGIEVGSLLAAGGLLTLHPIANTDSSDDLVIPNAATAGGMKFAYQYNSERIFNVEFHGYPDSVTKILFKLGSSLAA